MKEFNLGIIGLGNIGLEVYRNIKKNASDIKKRQDLSSIYQK